MGSGEWTREALLEFTEGKRLFLRSPEGEQLAVPEWLGAGALEVSKLDSAQSVDATHPDDRTLLIEAFIHAFEQPGVPIATTIRADLDGVWHHSEIVWVNLLDHPDVGGILCAASDVDGPEIEVPTRQVAGNMDATNWMIVSLDTTGRMAQVRGRIDEILGYTNDEVIGHVLTEYLHTDCLADAIENWVHLWEHPEQTRTSRWVWRRKDGTEVWLESSYLMHEDRNVEVVIVDVNEQVANERALEASQAEVAALAEDFRLLADEVPTAVFRCDADGTVQFHNAQWAEMFHIDGDVRRLHDVVDPDERPELDALLQALAGDAASGSQSIEVRGAIGTRVLEIRCRAASGGEGERFVGSITDVTAAAHFRHQALHDQLTGLANRTMIESRLADAIRTDPAGTLVAFIDLDGFKVVNDDHGHDAGDAVLVEVARRLSGAVRPGDSVARYGGDEFVVVCHGVGPHAEGPIIERLSEVFDAPIVLGEVAWDAGASLGVARPEQGVDAPTVLRRADQAMFEQKRARQSSDT
jgi:diguanylate cyclase (GGDEF)-like protein/PAS domain S-box-containing protein